MAEGEGEGDGEGSDTNGEMAVLVSVGEELDLVRGHPYLTAHV